MGRDCCAHSQFPDLGTGAEDENIGSLVIYGLVSVFVVLYSGIDYVSRYLAGIVRVGRMNT